MAGLCMRQGCGRTAQARLEMNAPELLVVLEDLLNPDDPVQMLCGLHANSLRAPLGWSISDNRSGRGVTPADIPRARTGPSASEEADAVSEESEASEKSEPEESESEQSESEDLKTDEADSSKPTPRRAPAHKESLLGRAFEWTGDQHSVLTQSSSPETDD
jgi:hypothetical protein